MNSDATLASFVPAAIIARATSGRLPAPPAAETLPGVVMFADLVGFTRLGERLAGRGREGAEAVATLVNGQLGGLVELIADHGGDVFEFAGDSVLAWWPTGDDPLPAVAAAAACGLAAVSPWARAGGHDDALDVRIAIALGSPVLLHLGALQGRRHHVLVGDCLQALPGLRGPPGAVVLDSRSVSVLGSRAVVDKRAGEGAVVTAVEDAGIQARALVPVVPGQADVGGYVPDPVRARLGAGHVDWLGELRTVTALFVALPDLDDTAPLDQAQAVVLGIETVLADLGVGTLHLHTDEKGVMLAAALGLPGHTFGDDAALGVRAALAVLDVLAEHRRPGGLGVTTGTVYVGTVGSNRRRLFTFIGRTVNWAARLGIAAAHERGTEPAVLCDEATRLGASERFDFAPARLGGIKGADGEVIAYRPRVTRKTQRRARRHTVLGRDRERRLLATTLLRLRDERTSAVVFLEGEAGIGKSTLLRELEHDARTQGTSTWWVAGDPLERATPYRCYGRLFHDLLDVPAGADSADRRAAVLHALGPGLAPLAPLLEPLVPADWEDSEVTRELQGPLRRERTIDLCTQLLQRSIGDGHALLLLDDAHWFDRASWAVSAALVERVSPLLVVVACRPLAAGTAAYDRMMAGASTVPLSVLDDTAIADLVAARLGVAALPTEVVEAVQARAGGHPLFAEQLALALRDAGYVRIHGGRCSADPAVDIDRVALPATVESAIASRTDQLAAGPQLTLRVASVLGAEIDADLLLATHPVVTEEQALRADLDALVRQDLLRATGGGAYAFAHDLIRTVVYEQLLYAQRRQLHARAAARLEHVRGDPSTDLMLLAHHWERAGERRRAASYLERAAALAIRQGLPGQAVDTSLDAAALMGEEFPRHPAEMAASIGEELSRVAALLADGGGPDGVRSLPPLEDERVLQLQSLLLGAQPAAAMSQQFELHALLALRNERLTLTHGNGPLAPPIHAVYAAVHRAVTGDALTADALGAVALEMAAQQGHATSGPTGFIHGWLLNHWLRPLSDNVALASASARHAFDQGDVTYGCFATAAEVIYLAYAGERLDRVEEAARRAGQVIANRVASAAFHVLLEQQVARALQGRTASPTSLSDGEVDEEADLAVIRATRSQNQVGYYLVAKLKLHHLFGEFEQALAVAREARAIQMAFMLQVAQPTFEFFDALTLLAAGDGSPESDDRVRAVIASLRGAAEVCPTNFAHRLRLLEGEQARHEGRLQDAAGAFTEATRLAGDAGDPLVTGLAHESLARALQSAGDVAAAAAHRREAAGAYGRWGAHAKVAALLSAEAGARLAT